jgi:hypothetical protein
MLADSGIRPEPLEVLVIGQERHDHLLDPAKGFEVTARGSWPE